MQKVPLKHFVRYEDRSSASYGVLPEHRRKMPDNEEERAEKTATSAAVVETASAETNTAGQVQTPAAPTTVTVKRPIVYTTSHGALVYDAETQAYWVQYGEQWLRIHEVLRTTITKDQARGFMKKCRTWTQAVEEIPKSFPNIKPSPHPILSVPLLCYNALQDSIIVTRNKKNSGLGQFYLDKVTAPYIKSIPVALPFLRPEFVSGCPCLQLQTYGPVVYCPACTTFRIPQAQQAQQVQQQTVTYKTISVVGNVTFYKPVADAIASMYCSNRKTGKFIVATTLETCNSIFKLARLMDIPIPKEVVLGFILRDSLFVRKFDNKVVSWSEYFRVKEGSFGPGEALSLLRIGLAIGTLGAIS
jgi:hypothetical protein